MRISHVCPFVGEQLGGSERYVYNLSRFQSSTHDVHIFTTTRICKKIGVTENDGVTYHRSYAPITIWNINPMAFMLPNLLQSASDVYHIHSHLYLLSNQAVLARRITGGKSLVHLHGGVGLPPQGASRTRKVAKYVYDQTLGRMTVLWADHLASVSYADIDMASRMYSLPAGYIHYVPNAVDTEMFQPSQNKEGHGRCTILFVGDLESWKGVDLLVRWVKESARRKDLRFTLRFVGQGTLYPELVNLRETCIRQDSPIGVEILGQRSHSEMPLLMRSADALILPSRWEGTPTVVLEAMASGLPAICTPVGDVSRIIQHGENGLILNASYNGFRDAVSFVADNPVEIKRITRNAREKVTREFGLQQVCKKLDDLYRSMVL